MELQSPESLLITSYGLHMFSHKTNFLMLKYCTTSTDNSTLTLNFTLSFIVYNTAHHCILLCTLGKYTQKQVLHTAGMALRGG